MCHEQWGKEGEELCFHTSLIQKIEKSINACRENPLDVIISPCSHNLGAVKGDKNEDAEVVPQFQSLPERAYKKSPKRLS